MYLIDFLHEVLTFVKNVFCLLFSSAFTSGHLLRYKSLEIEYYVGDFRRLTSDLNKNMNNTD